MKRKRWKRFERFLRFGRLMFKRFNGFNAFKRLEVFSALRSLYFKCLWFGVLCLEISTLRALHLCELCVKQKKFNRLGFRKVGASFLYFLFLVSYSLSALCIFASFA